MTLFLLIIGAFIALIGIGWAIANATIRKSVLRGLIVAVIGCVVLGGGIYMLKESEATQPQAIIEITASQLYSEYKANEIAADQKYKGKMLKVTGVVSSIGKDIFGSPYVVLTGGGEYEVWGVQCTFSSTYEPQLAKLTKGQQVTVTGKCKGYLINVSLEVK